MKHSLVKLRIRTSFWNILKQRRISNAKHPFHETKDKATRSGIYAHLARGHAFFI